MSTTEKKKKTPEEILAARKALEAAEKAEFWQAAMSLYIPLSLFLATCVFAAGAFMVYYEEPAGWGFIGATVLIALSAFVALIKFQNKFRAKGIIPTKDAIVESNIVDMSVAEGTSKDISAAPSSSPDSAAAASGATGTAGDAPGKSAASISTPVSTGN
ncbi:MAG: hypothetical protein JSS83_07335 [Cyanobacteria bacterium SZAS LIN-3]|nr:hypothetical protein [Cyanobacteria bacterium SZAS LIN-3]MBS2010993.1 hypothetical protein [Cyanobacteria bacterium SZAS TMP-1]